MVASSVHGIDVSHGVANWTRPTEFPDLSSGVKAVDLETNDVGLQTKMGPGWCFRTPAASGYILGVAVAHENGFVGYYPVRHVGGDNFDEQAVFSWLRHVLSGGEIVMHNSMYDLGWLETVGVRPAAGVSVFDTYIAATLAQWNDRHHNLDTVAKSLGQTGKNKDSLYLAAATAGIDKKNIMDNLARLPAHAVGPYAEYDVRATLTIVEPLREMIARSKLERVFDLESRLVPALLEMRRRGVRVDQSKCGALIDQFRQRIASCTDEIRRITGVEIGLWQSSTIDAALAHTGFSCPKTDRGQSSVTRDVLQGLAASGNMIAEAIVTARAHDKACQFVENIRKHAVSGRIHAEFHPLWNDSGGARTGRFSSANPNLQNMPDRDKTTARPIRRLFLPEDGMQWDCFDFSSQEPRITVHWANHRKLPGADEALRQYQMDNSHDFHAWAANLFSQPRKLAKILFLGTVYGQGGAAMCDELNLPTVWVVPPRWGVEVECGTPGATRVAGAAGQALRDAFDVGVPFVRHLQRECSTWAKRNGFIRTISGRMVPVPKGVEHKAINYMIQGSAADQMKLAIVSCHASGYVPRITVHDDNNFCDLETESDRNTVREIMEHCSDDWFSVPSKIDLESGPTWGDVS